MGGTGEYMKQKHLMRHFLDTMHPLEMNPSKSRLPPKPKNITTAADDAPLVDFAVPAGSQRPRTTGYSPGHIRTVMMYDTFGPNDSEIKADLRGSGVIPQSPNEDHYAAQSPSRPGVSSRGVISSRSAMNNQALEPFSDGGRPGTNQGLSNTAHLSTTSNFSNRSEVNTGIANSGNMKGLSAANQPSPSLSPVMGLSVDTSIVQRPQRDGAGSSSGSVGPTREKSSQPRHGFSPSRTNAEVVKVSYDQKAAIDPFTKSRQWHMGYVQSVEVIFITISWLSCVNACILTGKESPRDRARNPNAANQKHRNISYERAAKR